MLLRRFLKRKNRSDQAEVLRLLRLIVGQRLIGVTCRGKEWQLHFEDWVVFVENPFPSPIIERERG